MKQGAEKTDSPSEWSSSRIRHAANSVLVVFLVTLGWYSSSSIARQTSHSLRENAFWDEVKRIDDDVAASSSALGIAAAPVARNQHPTSASASYVRPLTSLDKFDPHHQGPDLSAMNETIEAVAFDEDGNRGYIADPYRLRKSVLEFLEQNNMVHSSLAEQYFYIMNYYEPQHRVFVNITKFPVDLQSTCSAPYGHGSEGPGGAALLSKKIQVYNEDENLVRNQSTLTESNNSTRKPRLLCMMYTYDKKRDLARAAALTWGVKCDGMVIFSTKTIPSLGMVNLSHYGPEAYNNMWQKTRSIWGYVGKHYLNQFDYFHLCGDDAFLIVENLRKFIDRLEATYPRDKKILTGGMVANTRNARRYIHGGTGYTMNHAAASWFISEQLPTYQTRTQISAEDRFVSFAFRDNKVSLTDSRDPETAEELYHPFDANAVYGKKKGTLMDIWASASHPIRKNETVGRKTGLDKAYKYSVGFHHIQMAPYFARYNAFIHKFCPKGTRLGDALV